MAAETPGSVEEDDEGSLLFKRTTTPSWREVDEAGLNATLLATCEKEYHVVVNFFAPWCDHCNDFKPKFAKIADRFRRDDRIHFVVINADGPDAAAMRKRFAVTVYPSLQLFLSGRKCPTSINKRGVVLPWYHPQDLLIEQIQKTM